MFSMAKTRLQIAAKRDGSFLLVVLLNIRSLSNKISELKATIETLNCSPCKIALTESWLPENDPIPFLSGYQKSFVLNRRGGGVCMFVKNGLNSFMKFSNQEYESITVCVNGTVKKFFFTLFYCSPGRNKFNYISHIEEQIKQNFRNHVILGDINIDLLSESDLKQNLIDTVKSYNFSINSKNKPTRETATTLSCIDFIASNLEVTESNILKTSISDHYAMQIVIPNASIKPEHYSVYRNLKVFDNQETRLKSLFS